MIDIPELVMSPLCKTLEIEGHSLEVHIYEDEEKKWILETVDVFGNSCVFDQHFETDQEAYDELLQAIKLEGIEEFVGEKEDSLKTIN